MTNQKQTELILDLLKQMSKKLPEKKDIPAHFHSKLSDKVNAAGEKKLTETICGN